MPSSSSSHAQCCWTWYQIIEGINILPWLPHPHYQGINNSCTLISIKDGRKGENSPMLPAILGAKKMLLLLGSHSSSVFPALRMVGKDKMVAFCLSKSVYKAGTILIILAILGQPKSNLDFFCCGSPLVV